MRTLLFCLALAPLVLSAQTATKPTTTTAAKAIKWVTIEEAQALAKKAPKPLFVDVYTSWCGPCRQENPNVVAAFNKFKDKNFTILGVSLDRPGQKGNWLEAIKKDKLTWTQVSDLQFWSSPVVPLYKIEGIPYNVLVDPQGKIIAENLRGPELESKLQQVLPQ